jgi:thiosulfate/3-mercaptopyruvate sulfurtransferase
MAAQTEGVKTAMTKCSQRLCLIWIISCVCCFVIYGQDASSDAGIPSDRLMQPAELAGVLQSAGQRPLILQVGSHVLFAEAHIPGAEYAGPGGQEGGLQALRDRVRNMSRDQPIVIYCGCCPWGKCPNIKPAYRELQTLGFTGVKALYIANNFGTDWVAKGYPVAKGR